MPIIYPNTADMIDMSPIEPGVYAGTILEADAKTSAKGNPMVVAKLEVQVNGKTKIRTSYLVVTGPGSGQFDQLLRACHMDDLADQFKNGESAPFDTDSLTGQSLMVRVEADTDDSGNIRDQIRGFMRA